LGAGRYPGQQYFRINFGDICGEPFAWLHIDPETLARACAEAGLACDVVFQEPDGHYLASIQRQACVRP
jgi:hypothetical protein